MYTALELSITTPIQPPFTSLDNASSSFYLCHDDPEGLLGHSLHIITPLQPHPDQAPCGDNHRPGKRDTPPRSLEVEPLAGEVGERHDIRPVSHLIDLRIIDVIRRVYPHNALHQSPRSKRPRRERRRGGIGGEF